MFLLFNIKEFLGTSIGGMFRGMLAGTYDMMLKLNELFSYDNQLVMQVSTSIYVVVGIFVLFRVLVAMLNYLIDPEKVSDKQVGAGKLLVRIVVSFALLLTLQSFIFPFLKRFEDSILDSGIIDKIFEKNQTLNLDDNNLLVNVSADVNESNIGISCTDSYKGAETYAWLAWNVAGKFGTFEDYYGNGTGSQWVDNAYNNQYMGPQFKVFAEAYDGCSLTNFINRFKEFMTVESDGKYQWQDNPSACGGKEACFSVGIPDACNDTKCLMDTESNIVSGMSEFNFDSKFYLCKNGDKKDCENVIFNSDAVDENTGEHLEVEEKFECDYIYRDTNSNLANLDGDRQYCNSNYTLAMSNSNRVHIVFTKTKMSNPKFSGLVYWDFEITSPSGSNLDIPNGVIRRSNNWFDSNAISNLDRHVCPNSIIGLTCSHPGSGFNCTVNDNKDGEVLFDSEGWLNTGENTSGYSGFTNYDQATFPKAKAQYVLDMYQNVCPDDENVKNDVKELVGEGYIDSDVISDCGRNYCGIDFARSLMSGFTSVRNKDNATAVSVRKAYLNTSDTIEEFATLYKKKQVDLDWLFAIVFCILAVTVLATICVEVVVRNLKIWILQIMAPIPIISYINPSDKNFNSWVKMYASAYLDLFFKLIAIEAGAAFLSAITNTANFDDLGIGIIFVMMGELVFIKTVPNLISRLFGVEGSSTFKDSYNMVKAGLGIGAGVAIASGMGLGQNTFTAGAAFANARRNGRSVIGSLGVGLGAFGYGLGNVAVSALSGAGGGAKGKLLAGSKRTQAINRTRRNAYNQGVGFKQQLTAATLGRVGLDKATRASHNIHALELQSNELKKGGETKSAMDQALEADAVTQDILNVRDKSGNPIFKTNQKKAAQKEYGDLLVDAYKYRKADGSLDADAYARNHEGKSFNAYAQERVSNVLLNHGASGFDVADYVKNIEYSDKTAGILSAGVQNMQSLHRENKVVRDLTGIGNEKIVNVSTAFDAVGAAEQKRRNIDVEINAIKNNTDVIKNQAANDARNSSSGK